MPVGQDEASVAGQGVPHQAVSTAVTSVRGRKTRASRSASAGASLRTLWSSTKPLREDADANLELSGQLSNQEVRAGLAEVNDAIAGVQNLGLDVSISTRTRRRWRLVDRLGEEVIRDFLEDRRVGMTKLKLAERYNISLSSMKRILQTML